MLPPELPADDPGLLPAAAGARRRAPRPVAQPQPPAAVRLQQPRRLQEHAARALHAERPPAVRPRLSAGRRRRVLPPPRAPPRSPPRAPHPQCASEQGLPHSLVSITPLFPLYVCDGGLVILSRFPLRYRDQIAFAASLFPQRLLSRGALYALLPCSDRRALHVVTTHLLPVSDDPAAPAVRRRQVRELVAFIAKKTRGDAHPILLCGDFSISASTGGSARVAPAAADDPADDLRAPIVYVEDDTDEYLRLVYALSELGQVRDVLYTTLARHPVTVGDTFFDEADTEQPLETVLTPPADLRSKRCQDYIFVIERGEALRDSFADVMPFDVRDQPFPFLSNHYGVTAVLDCSAPE